MLPSIATIPVDAERKAPTVKRPERFGVRGSAELVHRFPKANAIGLIAGKRNRITVVDIDTDDECVLADALNRHGLAPFIVRTASGGFHTYYGHNGERRRIRPFPGLPIDVIGAGLIVVPPSKTQRGTYEIIEGKLDDLKSFPPMRHAVTDIQRAQVREGGRNNALWEHCMRQAHYCDFFDALLDVARTFNDQTNRPPLHDAEVVKIAGSAWGYTERGENRFGHHGAFFETCEINEYVTGGRAMQDVLVLVSYLRANNRPKREFWIANGLADQFGWPLRRLQAARNRLIGLGRVELLRKAATGAPAVYRWPSQGAQKCSPILN